MRQRFFFGYGSLVNESTHTFSCTHPAQLRGWTRVWRKTLTRQAAYLTVIRDDTTAQIDGLIAEVPDADWAALDRREAAYSRVEASDIVQHPLQNDPHVVVYSIAPDNHFAPDAQSPVLLSYIDVVVQGYLNRFGEDGAVRFVETTKGWEAPIVNDRDASLYPRHQILTSEETSLVDVLLLRAGATVQASTDLSPWRE